LPALFLKGLAEEGGKEFWDAIVALHRKVATRIKGRPLGGLQTRLKPRRYRGVPIEVVLTLPNALYQNPDPLASLIRQCWKSLPEYQRAAEAMIDADLDRGEEEHTLKDRSIAIHGLVRGNRPNWKIEILEQPE
jgi:hypothetical protein